MNSLTYFTAKRTHVLLFFSVDALPLSEWNGNYTCDDDMVTVAFVMNFTHSNGTIGLLGDMSIASHVINMNGSFGSVFRTLTLQTPHVILDEINGRNFTKVELNVHANSTVHMEGVIIFTTSTGTKQCPLVLKRYKCKFLLWHLKR